MTMKGNKIFFEFDPFEELAIQRPKTGVAQMKREMADFVLTEVLNYVGAGKSPVQGGSWKRSLSPAYKKIKSKISGVSFANMELHGDMLDQMECVVNGRGNIELRIKGDEAKKADGHNNHSGRSNLPARDFIPKEDQFFKSPIKRGLKDIAMEFIEDGQT